MDFVASQGCFLCEIFQTRILVVAMSSQRSSTNLLNSLEGGLSSFQLYTNSIYCFWLKKGSQWENNWIEHMSLHYEQILTCFRPSVWDYY